MGDLLMAVSETDAVVAYWLDEIKQARKREEKYRKVGEEVLKLYEADEETAAPFNILFSNTETLKPALYSAQPRPVVFRRFKDADPMGKAASEATRRMLEFLLDTNREGYETVNEAMSACVLDGLLPGRGMIALKYDAVFKTYAEPRPPDEPDDAPVDESQAATYTESETICTESVIWDRVYFGDARKWSKLPWLAYEYHLTKEEVATLLGKEIAAKMTYSKESRTTDEESSSTKTEVPGARKTACVYQIWDKAGGKMIRYVSPHYPDGMLKEEEDPLGLTGFYNTPRPIMFVEKASSLCPTAPYQMYKNQAKELNRLTRRISRLIEAVKARGIYDGSLGDQLAKIMEQDDNTLIPADVASSLATEKGFANAIWFMPIEQLVAVLIQLYQAREACKQVIYEITGISDILRGATQASETATAQQIKNQWGTLRLKRMQAEVARYVRDLLRMMAELAATKFSEETWAQVTQLPYLTQQQVQQTQQMLMVLQQTGQPVPPELQQQMQAPVWQQVLEMLQNDLTRSYHIDIETNSTVEPGATEDKKELTELLTALGQVINGVGPLVAQGVMPFQMVQSIMLMITRQSRFAPDLEDQIQQMQPPKPPDDGQGEQAQQQMEMQKQQAMGEVQLKQKQAEMALQEKTMQADMQAKQREMELQMRELALQVKEQQHQMTCDMDRQSLELEKTRATDEIGVQRKIGDLENKKYKTENVVNKKADTTITQSVNDLKGLVEQLAMAVAQSTQQSQQMVRELVGAVSKPRTKRAIRGKDGRIEAVEELVS